MIRLALLALFLPTVALAQSSWETAINERMRRAGEFLRNEGYEATDFRRGALRSGELWEFEIDVFPGIEYVGFATCDNNCVDIDLGVYVGDTLVVIDQELDKIPVVAFTPPHEASVYIHVYMATCRVEPCSYGVAVFERETPTEP